MKDPNIVTYLHKLRRSTLFTLDKGFYDRQLCHRGYCLAMLAVRDDHIATYVYRLLRHPSFNTQAKRMGTVIRVSPTGLTVWRLHAETEEQIAWRG